MIEAVDKTLIPGRHYCLTGIPGIFDGSQTTSNWRVNMWVLTAPPKLLQHLKKQK
jgi:hypothetical protein